MTLTPEEHIPAENFRHMTAEQGPLTTRLEILLFIRKRTS